MNLYADNALLLAPLSGYTDLPYRETMRRFGCYYAFTEMIDASALVYARQRTEHMLTRGVDEPWLGVQLVSNNPEHLAIAVKLLNNYHFDAVDFNLGCPVPKVTKKGAGAALGRNIERALDLFAIISENSTHPVTAKVRILDRGDAEPTLKLVKGLVERGAQAVTVHGRIAKEFYSGVLAFDIIRQCKEALPVKVIANGGVMGLETYDEMRRESGCDAVMIARGSMGNPWLFSELQNRCSYTPPSLAELLDVMKFHVLGLLDFYGEEKGIRVARKTILDYLRGRGFQGEWRGRAALVGSKEEFLRLLAEAPQYHNEEYWRTADAGKNADRRLSNR